MHAVVVKSTGSWYGLLNDEGERLEARIKGKFRLQGLQITNPVAVGDEVEYNMLDDGTALITEILPRKNYVARQSPRKKHQIHLLASNIDQAILVITIVEPMLKQGFIDRFLLMTEPHNIPVTIVFNKSDLYGEREMSMYGYLKEIYEDIGYGCLLVSAMSGDGIGNLRSVLKDQLSLIAGQSGVGKSTLINAVEEGLGLKTGDLSGYTGKGQHTTTFAEKFELNFGGFIIDTPGIKTLSFNNLEPMDVAHNFRELFEMSKGCRFSDCTHRNEPGCAVKEGLETGQISELRYLNYIQIMDEIEEQNYWERRADL